ncbi:MAG: DUF349 domain-containing protein, partial [Flavobacteriales bacterium]|nr:DUF349 domain-containing protein [Flavobacteriales bacterium]
EITSIDNNKLSMDELIARISLLSENENPYSVSKEIEEIKSIFYFKLKAEQKEDTPKAETIEVSENGEPTEVEEEKETQKTLHPLEIKFKQSFSRYKKIKFDYRKKREQEESKNLKIKQQIILDIDKLTQEDESMKKTFEHFRILQEQWKNTGHVPQNENNNLWQSYHHHVELFYDFIKLNNDLRDLDFKRNLEAKTEIIKKAEDLLNEKSLNTMHNYLQELHEHWKNIGPVEREQREIIWEKFQEISRKLNKKRNDYFTQKKREDAKKLEQKNAVCKKISELTYKSITSHRKWQSLTNQCNDLEKEWKGIGRLGKTDNKTAWNNLRTALNEFYNKKNAFYKEKKEEVKETLNTKIAIAEKAEALQNSTDWQGTGNTLIKLQEEWKNSSFAPAKQSNEIWKRFRTACDTFFNARKAHYKELDKEKEGAYTVKANLLKEVESFKASSDTKEDIKKLKEFSSKWKTLGHVPRNKMKINDQFFTLLNSKFEDLGLSKKALANEQYKNKISSLKGNDKAVESEQRFLRGKIDTLIKDISQYENNISFFGHGKGTEPLKKQVEQQIEKAKKEIEELKSKLQMLK